MTFTQTDLKHYGGRAGGAALAVVLFGEHVDGLGLLLVGLAGWAAGGLLVDHWIASSMVQTTAPSLGSLAGSGGIN